MKSKYADRLTLGAHQNNISQSTEYRFNDEEEMQRKMSDPHMLEEMIWSTVDLWLKHKPNKNCFVQLNMIRDKIMPNIVKYVWAARATCPDPWYNEAVWFYNAADDNVEILWSLPDPDSCKAIASLQAHASEGERALVKFITDYNNGTLQKIADKHNKITKDTVFLLDPSYMKVIKAEEN